ncbi:tetratricopeptide repeat protein [Streptomyces sp. 549]|uniref:tetratricopeptide repeat protein n=1 Tax=Streptomyces sp. 549 TaxID=3049076 RepID=UPI0024C45649|nr:tetratricopeptide repeat protein [Streptomyces sp. 549]MDK1475641.1 tetratricopeptide repeat protein [Streptomyces sp. 549]
MTDQAVHTGTPATNAGAGTFFGRERELDALREDVERAGLDTLAGRPAPRARVLLIAGRPGSGRTALAEEFARRVAGNYPGGVLRARLTDPGGAVVPLERVARDLLDLLAVPAPAGAGPDELTDVLRSALAERGTLLLLDDVAAAEQLLEVVPESRDCLVVATAEGPLTGVPDVRPCTLGGLDSAAAVHMLADRAGSEIRITVDPRAAEALADCCGHQPAALALAGGWLAARPQVSVLDAARRLAALGDEARPVTSAFRLVHESLPAEAARTLRLLCLAPDGYVDAALAAGLAGCSVPAAQRTLEDFARLGLLEPAGEDAHRVPGWLDPLLRGLLENRERPADVLLARARLLERAVRLLHSCWAVTEPDGTEARRELAEQPRPLRFGSPAAAARWLDSRLPALLAAARLAVADGELDTLARRFIGALARALNAHRTPEQVAPEQYRLHELVLSVAQRRGLHRERAAALLNLGDLDARTGRLPDALARYREALAACRADEDGDPQAAVRAMDSMGGTYAELDDWHRAADWYGRALAQCQVQGDLEGVARLHGRIGGVQIYAGQWGEALHAWRASAAVHRRLRNPQAQARALSEVARVQEYAGRPREAMRSCHDALGLATGAGDTRLQAALRLRLADTCERMGEPGDALAHRAEAERLLGETGDSAAESQATSEATCEIHSDRQKG